MKGKKGPRKHDARTDTSGQRTGLPMGRSQSWTQDFSTQTRQTRTRRKSFSQRTRLCQRSSKTPFRSTMGTAEWRMSMMITKDKPIEPRQHHGRFRYLNTWTKTIGAIVALYSHYFDNNVYPENLQLANIVFNFQKGGCYQDAKLSPHTFVWGLVQIICRDDQKSYINFLEPRVQANQVGFRPKITTAQTMFIAHGLMDPS